jgi:hypothetical protein
VLSPGENAHGPDNPLLQHAHRLESLILQLKPPRNRWLQAATKIPKHRYSYGWQSEHDKDENDEWMMKIN